ncbi:MAG: type II toxin-antitoxin system VapC family toxin [Candidatus Brockarchaeota archaeon]|nr:type II toxin-antitoxin system VapC family toxin [Candidatus Brockarchaeota archaeon]MBO3768437.1 type II toxin-antitoxin system VapC family toxin [Candidatus Brockarchaeota archaeon]MBO3802035.1 type II toxin-antitoxin system VapC family toxin [Candidatus Brockarchaeota archaeon]
MEGDLYDTSKLIEMYKKGGAVHGYTTILNLIEFPKAINLNLTIIFPSKFDYNLALKISTELLRRGNPIPATDLIIAAVALNDGLRLVTKDKHFLLVKEVENDFKVLVD